jgi:hypothetical protein
MRYVVVASSIVLAISLWTAPTQSADPRLLNQELPPDPFDSCDALSVHVAVSSRHRVDYRSRWIGHSAAGDLFIVDSAQCSRDPCPVWLVTKDGYGKTHVVLRATGELRWEPEKDAFPVIETRRASVGGYATYDRYRWAGERYEHTDSRRVHRVDGIDCDEEATCQAAAEDALRHGGVDRAVKIWQQVYGVSWI